MNSYILLILIPIGGLLGMLLARFIIYYIEYAVFVIIGMIFLMEIIDGISIKIIFPISILIAYSILFYFMLRKDCWYEKKYVKKPLT